MFLFFFCLLANGTFSHCDKMKIFSRSDALLEHSRTFARTFMNVPEVQYERVGKATCGHEKNLQKTNKMCIFADEY